MVSETQGDTTADSERTGKLSLGAGARTATQEGEEGVRLDPECGGVDLTRRFMALLTLSKLTRSKVS
eukprot:COSAG05_NODE_1752_length_4149_cov_2.831108_5_plen_67_part_00